MPDLNDLLNRPFAHPTPKPKYRSHYDTAVICLKYISEDELKSLKKEINKLLRQQFREKISTLVNKREKVIAITCAIISTVVAIIALILQILM